MGTVARVAIAILLGVTLAALVAYLALPALLPWIVSKYVAAEHGDAIIEIELSEPSRVKVPLLEFERDGVRVLVRDMSMTYSASSIAAGRFETIEIESIVLSRTAGAEAGGDGMIASPWTLIPAERVTVSTLTVQNAAPEVTLIGRANLDSERLSVEVTVDNFSLSSPLNVVAGAERDGSLELRVSATDSTTTLTATGKLSGNVMTFEGRYELDKDAITQLADLVGIQASGRADGNFKGSIPWPPPGDFGPGDATADGDIEFDLTIEEQTIRSVATTGIVPIKLEAGVLQASRAGLVVSVPRVEIGQQQISFPAGRLQLEHLTMSGDSLAATGQFRARLSPDNMPVDFRIDANVSERRGTFRIDGRHHATRALLRTELRGWESDYDLESGDIAFDLEGAFSLDDTLQVNGSGEIAVTNGATRYARTMMTGVETTLPISVNQNVVTVGPGAVAVGLVDIGFPVTDLRFSVETDFDVFKVGSVRADVLGGEARVDALTWDASRGASPFNLQLDGIEVAEVLALEGDKIVGDGIIDGILPVTITPNGVAVSDGVVGTRQPGGRLSYRSDLPAGNPGLELAIRALRNFQYSLMRAEVDLDQDGSLQLAVRLEGRSPDVENGRPIHFNLNVTENVHDLLRSLRAADNLSERVQDRLSR